MTDPVLPTQRERWTRKAQIDNSKTAVVCRHCAMLKLYSRHFDMSPEQMGHILIALGLLAH